MLPELYVGYVAYIMHPAMPDSTVHSVGVVATIL